ncbi:carbohydrate ABC transporter permease [Halosimplex rubrum]|uniref:Carbohydrate ABC transporter permease n=1 Tax=Halosimplex rubrum TaxID=869889 RepID=A0A7D5P671_9EURY|nr:carbohydrate ABC transporter permease [Halosimplex rubrum]QLH78302.1 carbohydrate ABC transporter permease [Halosimplex rubrum]
MAGTTSTTDETRFGWDRIENAAVYAVMYGLALLFFLPLYRTFQLSITPTEEMGTFKLFPAEPTLTYWQGVLANNPVIYRWALNTLIIAGVTTLLVVVIDSMIAFSLTRLEWRGRKAILGIIIASFMVPPVVNIIPLFTLVNRLGMINSYWAVILPFVAGPLGVFLLVQFFRDIPEELEEAARMDGFSTPRIYARIILPLSAPILTALAIFIFVWSWNQFLWPLIVLQEEAKYTLPIGATTLESVYVNQPNQLMAQMLVISMPLFVLFLLFQEKLISSIQMQAATG